MGWAGRDTAGILQHRVGGRDTGAQLPSCSTDWSVWVEGGHSHPPPAPGGGRGESSRGGRCPPAPDEEGVDGVGYGPDAAAICPSVHDRWGAGHGIRITRSSSHTPAAQAWGNGTGWRCRARDSRNKAGPCCVAARGHCGARSSSCTQQRVRFRVLGFGRDHVGGMRLLEPGYLLRWTNCWWCTS